jgi:hypothetical protein
MNLGIDKRRPFLRALALGACLGGLFSVRCGSSNSGGGTASASAAECAKSADCETCCERSPGYDPYMQDFIQCECKACQTECASSACATPSKDPTSGDACDQCVHSNASSCSLDAAFSCENDAKCKPYIDCLAGCGDGSANTDAGLGMNDVVVGPRPTAGCEPTHWMSKCTTDSDCDCGDTCLDFCGAGQCAKVCGATCNTPDDCVGQTVNGQATSDCFWHACTLP